MNLIEEENLIILLKRLQNNMEKPKPSDISFAESLKTSSVEGLQHQAIMLSKELHRLGADSPLYGVIVEEALGEIGWRFEDTRDSKGFAKVTPINLLMSFLHFDPDLKDLPLPIFEQLVASVSQASMVLQELELRGREVLDQTILLLQQSEDKS
jgi:hypothetical protein